MITEIATYLIRVLSELGAALIKINNFEGPL